MIQRHINRKYTIKTWTIAMIGNANLAKIMIKNNFNSLSQKSHKALKYEDNTKKNSTYTHQPMHTKLSKKIRK